MKKLYVGNLPFTATEDEIRRLFETHGDVHSVSLITDRDTGRPRGFGFVEMEPAGATKAIAALNETDLQGRTLSVSEARSRPERPGGGGGRERRDRW